MREEASPAAPPPARRYPFLPPDREVGWVPYLWLVYSLQIPLLVWFENGGWFDWLVAALAMAVFLPLYFYSHWVSQGRSLLVAAAMVALAIACARWNPGVLVFFIYAASPIARSGLARWWMWLAGMLLILAAGGWFWRWPVNFTAASAVMSVIVGVSVAHDAERRQANRRLALAQDEIGRLAQIAERERIARDLHDLLGHTLSVIVLKSELASRLSASDDHARAAAEIGEVETIARDALTQVRAAVRGYKSVGLAAELDHARKTLASAGVQLENEISGAVSLSPSQEGVLTLAIREAVTNIVRHAAGATHCRLSLGRREDGLAELRIADNGRPASANGLSGSFSADGFGIQGMRERVEALGGTVTRTADAGTELVVRFPI